MNQDDKSTVQRTQSPEEVDQFFTKLQSDMRRPDLSQDAIAEAFDSIQRLAQEAEPAKASGQAHISGAFCPSCGTPNSSTNNFCSSCGSALRGGPRGEAAPPPGRHHYHHHYHHHEFAGGSPALAPFVASNAAASASGREVARVRTPGSAQPMGRSESALRKISQDWAFACNTKHLDDMVSLYTTDAMVMRANVPPVRGTAAIRELFFGALDAGLGEVEFEPLRVELFGDIGYEVGRCKMLVPSASGKRREERGKYLTISHKQEGEWKIIADSWSTDLSLSPGGDIGPKPVPGPSIPPRSRK